MNKCCMNCKYYYAGECKNKEFKSSIKSTKEGYSYSEDGYLKLALEENLDINLIADEIVYLLKKNDMLKKKYDQKKIDFKDTLEEHEIHNLIDDALYTSLSNYFSSANNSTIEINNIREFYCCYYE